MSTSKQVKHLIQVDAFGIGTKIKQFQKNDLSRLVAGRTMKFVIWHP